MNRLSKRPNTFETNVTLTLTLNLFPNRILHDHSFYSCSETQYTNTYVHEHSPANVNVIVSVNGFHHCWETFTHNRCETRINLHLNC